jgi:hypothetical protein
LAIIFRFFGVILAIMFKLFGVILAIMFRFFGVILARVECTLLCNLQSQA